MGACHKPFPHLQRKIQSLIQTRPGSQHPPLCRCPRPGDSWRGVHTSKQRCLWTAWTHVEWRWWSAHKVQMWIVNEEERKKNQSLSLPLQGRVVISAISFNQNHSCEPSVDSLSLQAEPLTMPLLTVAYPLWRCWGVTCRTSGCHSESRVNDTAINTEPILWPVIDQVSVIPIGPGTSEATHQTRFI